MPPALSLRCSTEQFSKCSHDPVKTALVKRSAPTAVDGLGKLAVSSCARNLSLCLAVSYGAGSARDSSLTALPNSQRCSVRFMAPVPCALA